MNISSKKILSLFILLTIFLIPSFALGFELTNIDELNDSSLSERSVSFIIRDVMNWLLVLITILSVISFIISGIFFIFGGNNSNQIETAKNWLVYSIIGIVVSLSGYVVINLIYDLSSADMTYQAPPQIEETTEEE
ncbi:MAG: hypothetical protein PF549_05025 [Patescibacteria group bacterium]|jgi:magnesium-transporting ATPase (P-type)|nr:hypothetical protein [Patescibacteria group bacterium]